MNITSKSMKMLTLNLPKLHVVVNGFKLRKIDNLRKGITSGPVKMAFASYESTTDFESTTPPLTIMHGLFGSKGNWNSLCKVYQQKTEPQRKVVAVDARNHGESPHSALHNYDLLASDLKQLIIDELKVEKAALMGHSMGGRAVMNFAFKYPNFVDRLIVVDISPIKTSPNLDSLPPLFLALKSLQLPKGVPMSTARTQTERQLMRFCTDKPLRAFLLTNLVQKDNGNYAWRINIDSLLENFQNIARFPIIDGSLFNGPTLFIGGGSSDFIPTTDHSDIMKLFPKAEIKYIPGAGHWLHSEKPAEFLSVTLEFLNRKL